MAILEGLYFTINSEWQPCWIKDPWLHVFLSKSFKNAPPQLFLSFQVCVDRSDVILIPVPWYVRNFFALATFNTVPLDPIFANCTMMWHGVGLFSLTLGGVPSASWTPMLISFARFGKLSATICSNISSRPLSFSSPQGCQWFWHWNLLLSQ